RWSFPIVGVAAVRRGNETTVALAGVAPTPWLLGSLEDATPLPGAAYKLEIATALVRRGRARAALPAPSPPPGRPPPPPRPPPRPARPLPATARAARVRRRRRLGNDDRGRGHDRSDHHERRQRECRVQRRLAAEPGRAHGEEAERQLRHVEDLRGHDADQL